MLSQKQIESIENFVLKENISYQVLMEYCCSKIAEVNTIVSFIIQQNEQVDEKDYSKIALVSTFHEKAMNCQQLQYSELFFFVVDVNEQDPQRKDF